MNATVGNIGIKQDTSLNIETTKANFKYEIEKKKIDKELKDKLIEKLLSSDFFVFIIIIIILSAGIIYIYSKNLQDSIEFWKIILPVITTYIGYAIGKNQSN